MDYTEKKRLKNPEIGANPVSRFLFLWIVPLFRKGSKGQLTIDDLYDRLPEDDAGALGHTMEKKWEDECQNAKLEGKKPSFLRTVRKLYAVRFMLIGIVVIFDELALKIGQTLLLRKVISCFSDEAKAEKDIEMKQYLYTTALIVITMVHSLLFHKLVVAIMHLAMKARLGTASVVYRKVLRLRKTVQSEEANIGKLVNIIANDCNSYDHVFFHAHQLVAAPLQLIILTYLLWTAVGVSCMVGVGIILTVLIPFQFMVGRYSMKFRKEVAKRTDARGNVINEIITGIRIIKMYGWEIPFSGVIHKLRKLEIVSVRKAAYLKCAFMSLMQLSRVTIPFCTFIVFVSLGNELTAEVVYFTISIYTLIIQGMVQRIPIAAAQFGEFLVSIRRIESVLLLDEQTMYDNTSIFQSNLNDKLYKPASNADVITSSLQPNILMDSVTAMWTDAKTTLENISLDVSGNQLVMVVGTVASGKSSLLNLLISELPIHSGKLKVTGKMSYASQEAWIFSSNVRQNILFGAIYDESRYQKIVHVCALEADLEQLPHGDLTIVGERGVSLSGGQKARINLARCLYRKADIYLMDDPLSAVDSHVSQHLFQTCIQEFLNGSLRILITHQLQYLPHADHIVVLNENGKIISQGKYEALVAEGVDFVNLLANAEVESSEKVHNPKSETKVVDKTSAINGIIKQTPKLKEETMQRGSVTAKTYGEYFKSGNSRIELVFIFSLFFISQGVVSFTDLWLSAWTNEVSKRSQSLSSNNSSSSSNSGLSGYSDNTYIVVYTACVVGVVFIISMRSVSFFHYCMSISCNLHNRMFAALIRAPVKFFDDNPSGRILNRFSKDINSIDERLPMAFFDSINIALFMIGIIIVVITSNYYIAIPSAFLIFGLVRIRRFFVKTARDLKRLESIAKSPTFAHLSASVEGLSTIRALGTQEKLIDQFDAIQNIHSSPYYLIIVSNRWFGMWLDLVCLLFLICVAFSFTILSSSTEVGNVGLAITLTLTLMGTSQWGMRQSAETENQMTSVERVLEFCRIEPEAALESDEDNKPPKNWPSTGSIRFSNVTLSYNKPPNQTDVLKNLNFEILGNEKIGVVGRTGAGKSSILQALFRMTEPRGLIYIDGICINEIGLHDLRKAISIIPQDPVLFSGTMRYNLDPFNQFKDNELWKVLKEVNLGDAVPSLDFKVSDGGGNFSVGQKQLVCLARAILKKTKILVLDEATANVDHTTDLEIQQTIRSKFADCTIITIAHRLNSVIESDRILVLENGYLKEFDTPANLLKNSDTMFSKMVHSVKQL